MSNIVVFGIGQWAELAHFYFMHDSPHRVVAFTVDGAYLDKTDFQGLPVYPFEEIERHCPANEVAMFVPISFKRMNHARAEKYEAAKTKGYKLVSYVSSRATIFPNFKCGDNCFILEDNTIQPFVSIGNNVVLWSGNHIGHHSRIADHVMVTSQVVISGGCTIEPYCFLGVNATIRDETVLARETLVGAGIVILKDTKPFEVYKASTPEPASVKSDQLRSLSHKSRG